MWRLAVLVIGGCSFSVPRDQASDADPSGDASDDGEVVDGLTCFGSPNSLVRLCTNAPLAAVEFAPGVLDTSPGSPGCAADVAELCVMFGSSIQVSESVRVIGPRPLVLAANTISIPIGGSLDASSRRNADAGPGANSPECKAASAPGTAGGGAGGTFTAVGGNGGSSDGGAGIHPSFAALPDHLRGGCAGGAGGTRSSAIGGAGGAGGGALYLIASIMLSIEGSIDVSGAGGSGGGSNAVGAGGGGSGGMLGLDAPQATITGQIFAVGGGGGEGAGMNTAGNAGGESSGPSMGGAGGAGSTSAGADGGVGGRSVGAVAANGNNANPGMGGGGGGGGAYGLIVVSGGAFVDGALAPAPTNL